MLRGLHGQDGESDLCSESSDVKPRADLPPCVLQHENFEEQMQGMKTQLIQLSSLLRLLDLAFWNYLGTPPAAVRVCLL